MRIIHIIRNSLLLGSLLAFLGQTASASPILDVRGGELFGASGVDISGTLYDVTFQDGTCIGLFDGCDNPSDFLFSSTSLNAATALIDQVFLGAFDSTPALINGCTHGAVCAVYTPFFAQPGTQVRSTLAVNAANELFDAGNLQYGVSRTFDLALASDATWAVWSEHVAPTATVPEPGSLVLLSLGIAGICLSRRRYVDLVVRAD